MAAVPTEEAAAAAGVAKKGKAKKGKAKKGKTKVAHAPSREPSTQEARDGEACSEYQEVLSQVVAV
jgi:hypothetical protein